MRKDYIQDKYVLIAPRRAGRPYTVRRPERDGRRDARECALCPEEIDQEKALLTVGPRSDWRIKVVSNRFPAVSVDNPRAYGVQEVVIETPHPERQLDDLPVSAVVELLEAYAARTVELTEDPRIQYILIFKNDGGRAGASIAHSHSQIFATDFIPPHLLDKSKKTFEYKLHHGTCPYCDVIGQESRGPRLVHEDDQIVVFTPYASMHNYELWILPRRHLDNITALNGQERKSWAKALKRALRAIGDLGLPYNYYFHQIIYDQDQHLYMKITPRGSVWAGVEIGSGIIINPIPPEKAATYYRRFFR
ncbi:hypothetical protein AMJ57_00735 [Parcubacteria bacterium SG8_24]|nr:MAG: hypothetical protein AMJ57_00735 [Parcubacteria bacterium SG8_24]